MNIIITEISEGITYYKDLNNWVRELDINPISCDFDAISFMEGDPDIIKFNEFYIYFITVDIGDIKYILTSDHPDKVMSLMLKHFFQDDFDKHYTNQLEGWESFDKASSAIAYREGSGYVYSIWEYKNDKINN